MRDQHKIPVISFFHPATHFVSLAQHSPGIRIRPVLLPFHSRHLYCQLVANGKIVITLRLIHAGYRACQDSETRARNRRVAVKVDHVIGITPDTESIGPCYSLRIQVPAQTGYSEELQWRKHNPSTVIPAVRRYHPSA